VIYTRHSESPFKVALLDGSSHYRAWKFSMKMVLLAKELWGVVIGTQVKPDTDALE
jgi:Domain of unknown function (DUF4219)